jgi:hypothetical protein
MRIFHFFFKSSGNDTKDKIAPENCEDEGAGEKEVEDGDSHSTNLDGEAQECHSEKINQCWIKKIKVLKQFLDLKD